MAIIILGSTGFLGNNLKVILKNKNINAFYTFRTGDQKNEEDIYFDLTNKDTWVNILNLNPSIIINCIAYGVVKDEIDLKKMYDINYFLIREFYLYINNKNIFWLQIGTAFEYDLTKIEIDEKTPCLPNTHYGISKLLMSNYFLNNYSTNNFIVLRPFGMFGPFESSSKIFPMLINAQIHKIEINLSPGTQLRDYVFINDVVNFIITIINNSQKKVYPNLINVGSNNYLSFLEYADILKNEIYDFNPSYWNWNSLKFREDDFHKFYSKSRLCYEYGFKLSSLRTSFKETYIYYKNLK